MNILKKIISTFLGFIILIAISTLGAIYIARNFLSGENLVNLALNTTNNADYNYSKIVSEIGKDNSIPNLDDYVNDTEIKESLEEMMNDTLKYYSGLPDAQKPSTDKIKEIVKDSLKEYEKNTGKKVDYVEVDKSFDEIDDTLEKEISNLDTTENANVKKVLNFIYSDKIVTIASIAIIVSLILIILLERSLSKIARKVAVIFIFNGLGNNLLSLALNKIFQEENNQAMDNILSSLTTSFDKIAKISFIIGVISLIISIILSIIKRSKRKKEKQIEENSKNNNNNNNKNKNRNNNNNNNDNTDEIPIEEKEENVDVENEDIKKKDNLNTSEEKKSNK